MCSTHRASRACRCIQNAQTGRIYIYTRTVACESYSRVHRVALATVERQGEIIENGRGGGEDERRGKDLCEDAERKRGRVTRRGDAWSEKGDTKHTRFEDAYSSEVDCAKARPYTLISPIASRAVMRPPKILIPSRIPYIEIRSRESRWRRQRRRRRLQCLTLQSRPHHVRVN